MLLAPGPRFAALRPQPEFLAPCVAVGHSFVQFWNFSLRASQLATLSSNSGEVDDLNSRQV